MLLVKYNYPLTLKDWVIAFGVAYSMYSGEVSSHYEPFKTLEKEICSSENAEFLCSPHANAHTFIITKKAYDLKSFL